MKDRKARLVSNILPIAEVDVEKNLVTDPTNAKVDKPTGFA